MNIHYSKQKKEMRDDPVMDFFLAAKDWTLKNANAVAAVVIVCAFIMLGLVFFHHFQKSGVQKAEEAFGAAMIDYESGQISKAAQGFQVVADNHRSTAQGATSAYMLGSIFLIQNRYDQAITWFQTSLSSKSALSFISGECLEGLGVCYEAKGNVKQALEYYGKALNYDQIKYRHPDIRWRMALLTNAQKDAQQARELCRQILSDTTAVEYREKAQSLLSTLSAGAS